MNDQADSLNGKLLIAMPSLEDPRFERAVIFMCAHDPKGAMGIVINKTATDLTLSKLLEDFSINLHDKDKTDSIPVFVGGPVETRRGFLLHSSDFQSKDTIKVNDDYAVTGTIEALKQAMGQDGPHAHLFALGYAGWSAGQIEKELIENSWLICEADKELIFSTNIQEKWSKALAILGIDPSKLNSTYGLA
jgi:putative transcriptional regulator